MKNIFVRHLINPLIIKLSFLKKQFLLGNNSIVTFIRIIIRHYVFLAKSQIHSATPLTIVTFSINPSLSKIWMYYMKKMVDEQKINANIVVFDSSGLLKPYKDCKVIPVLNIEHGERMDNCIHRLNSEYIWITDDDIVFDNLDVNEIITQLAHSDQHWVYSIVPRGQKVKSENGIEQRAIGSYSIILKRSVFIREKLSFKVHQTDNTSVNWGNGYYDTCDYAHKVSLDKGYLAYIGSHEKETLSFFGTSIVYLKFLTQIKTAPDYNSWIAQQQTDRKINGAIGSTYCLLKINELFDHLFNTQSKKLPIDEQYLREFISQQSPEVRTSSEEHLSFYEQVYQKILTLA